MSRFSRGIVAVGVLAALAFGLSPANAVPPPPPLDPDLCSPENPDNFTLKIDNPYYPLRPGQRSVYFGVEDDESLGLQITVLKTTEVLYPDADPIVTRVVKETEWVDDDADGKVDRDEDLIEISLNYFAQTQAGTVCYFGEEVDIFQEDGTVTHEGSWRADDPDSAPGIFMPANPQTLQVGTEWFMEDSPFARDLATFEGVENRTVPAGTFQDSLEITDCNTLEHPVDCGTKFYASGVGLIEDGVLKLTKFLSPGKK